MVGRLGRDGFAGFEGLAAETWKGLRVSRRFQGKTGGGNSPLPWPPTTIDSMPAFVARAA